MNPTPALVAERLSYAYRRGRPVLRDVSFEAQSGEVLAILGTSGSGKTTLLKICRGLLGSREGSVRVLGQPVHARRGALDPRIAYIPQQLGLVRSLSVQDNILVGALARRGAAGLLRLGTSDLERRALEIAQRLGIAHKLGEKAYALSGGERQRVAIARALLQGARVLLADEFISQLDPLTTSEIMRLVRQVADDDGVAVVMTTHEHEIVREHADRAIVLRDGAKVVDVRTRSVALAEITRALGR